MCTFYLSALYCVTGYGYEIILRKQPATTAQAAQRGGASSTKFT